MRHSQQALILSFLLVFGGLGILTQLLIQDCDVQDTECTKEKIIAQVQAGQVENALVSTEHLYLENDTFKTQCHLFMHTLGEHTYSLFKEGVPFILSREASQCTNGFYHGFIIALIEETGDFTTSLSFCNTVKEKASGKRKEALFGSCLHGVGNGIVYTEVEKNLNPSHILRDSTEQCLQLSNDALIQQKCLGGVFNGFVGLAKIEGYPLFENTEPFSLCADTPTERGKDLCYHYFSIAYLVPTRESVLNSLERIISLSSVPLQYKIIAIRGIALGHAKAQTWSLMSAESFAHNCTELPEIFSTACLEGLSAGFIQKGYFGKDFEHIISLCEQANSLETQNSCFSMSATELQNWQNDILANEFCDVVKTTNAEYSCNATW